MYIYKSARPCGICCPVCHGVSGWTGGLLLQFRSFEIPLEATLGAGFVRVSMFPFTLHQRSKVPPATCVTKIFVTDPVKVEPYILNGSLSTAVKVRLWVPEVVIDCTGAPPISTFNSPTSSTEMFVIEPAKLLVPRKFNVVPVETP